MKKKILILLLLIIPIFINAKMNNTFEVSTKYTNRYITGYPYYKKYILLSNMPFKYKDSTLSKDSRYELGGLLNLQEFNISKDSKGYTYLFDGSKYWTMTDTDSSSYIITDDTIDNTKELVKTSSSGTRITEYIRENVGVTGSGTYSDPWMFTGLYEITMKSSDETKGTVSPTEYIAREGEKVSFNVNLIDKYEYASNDCNLVYKNGKLTIDSVSRNMDCTVNFKNPTITITYNNNGGSGCSTKSMTSGDKIGSLCAPTKSSNQFAGWYKSDGTKVDESTVFTESTTITARWTPIFLVKYDYTNNGGSSSNATNQQVLSGNTANLSFTASKSGYTFLGWNTNVNATSALKSFKPTANTTLYAIYRKTLTITYKDYQGTRTDSIYVYNKATSGQITLLSERTFKDNCGGSSWNNTYTNLGWTTGTSTDGSITYSNGQTITISSNFTLNGQYKKEVRAVLDGNGGSCTPGYLASDYWIYYNAGSNSFSSTTVAMKVKIKGITCTRSGKRWRNKIECDKTKLTVNGDIPDWTFVKGCAVYCEALW